MGIIEDMMCMVLSVAINNPIVYITATTAIIKGDMININDLKNRNIEQKIINMAKGADIAICLNISTPNVSSATGRPVIKNLSFPLKVFILFLKW